MVGGQDVAAQEDDPAVLAEELRRAVGAFVRQVRQAADTPSATWSDALGTLDRHGPMTVAVLARRNGVRHQSMRVTVARLEAEGMVVRAPDPADARGQIVQATAAGRAALAASRGARAGWIAAALRESVTPAERRAVRTTVAVLRRLSGDDD